MLWNKKRLEYQVYKLKKQREFLVTFGKPYLTNCAMIDMFAGVTEYAAPNYNSFCHTSGSLEWLSENCYAISQKQLQKFPDWYKFFKHYIEEYYNDQQTKICPAEPD